MPGIVIVTVLLISSSVSASCKAFWRDSLQHFGRPWAEQRLQEADHSRTPGDIRGTFTISPESAAKSLGTHTEE